MGVGVLCAVRGASEPGIVQAVDATAGRLSVTRRCADVAELLAAAHAGLGRVALVSADLPMLDRDAIGELHRCGLRVVGVRDPTATDQRERLAALGADVVVDVPTDGPAAVALVRDVVAALDDPGAARAGRASPPVGPGPAFDIPTRASARERRGRVVAVWGPTGAPGRTTIATNLAGELALISGPTLLVDGDTYGGTITQAVGLLDEGPGLAAAARSAAQGVLDSELLARMSPAIAPDLRVLAGIARADRWPELPSAALDVIWAVARTLAAWTVVDCGFCLEQDDALGHGTPAPRRNAATLSALHSADDVVVVGSGDPVGLQRLVRACRDLAELGLGARTIVVVNRIRTSAAGPRPGATIADALDRYAGIRAPHLVPDDRATLDRAMLEGRLLHEIASASPTRRSIAALATRFAESIAESASLPAAWSTPARETVALGYPARLASG